MTYSIEFLSTRSGKALLLKQGTKHYLFGYYEGFQRHSIERNVKLPKIANVYLFNEHQVISLLGFCLTVADMGRKMLWIYGPENIKNIFSKACCFAKRSKLTMIFGNNNNEVVPIRTVNGINYVIRLPNVKGQLDISKLDPNFPVQLRKNLKERKKVIFNNKIYDGNDYMKDDHEIGDLCILYNIDDLTKCLADISAFNVKLFICMNKPCLLLKNYFQNSKFVLFKDSSEIEYRSFYELQKKLNKIDENYILPKKWITEMHTNLYSSGDGLKQYPVYQLSDTHSISFCKNNPFSFYNDEKNREKIIFLGTGCAIPSKYRNVSSIIYEEDNCAYLLDCGEDTLAQIDRVYGGLDILQKIQLIFISHSHADHHLGLFFVLRKICHEVVVLCPRKVKNFLSHFNLNVRFFVTDNNHKREISYLSFNLNKNNIKISLCPMDHISDSYGIRINGKYSISYSGDCRPSPFFADMSNSVDVMIHEATFTEEYRENAIQTKHSTINEAVDIYRKSGASALILTHFSQRFAKTIPSEFEVFYASDFFRYNFKNKVDNRIRDYLSSINDL